MGSRRRPVRREIPTLKIPAVTVSATMTSSRVRESEIVKILADAGVRAGWRYHRDPRVGFAGIKGFAGGFGRQCPRPLGRGHHQGIRPRRVIDEALKLESALAREDRQLVASSTTRRIQGDRRRRAAREFSVSGLQPAGGPAHAVSRHRRVPRAKMLHHGRPEGRTSTGCVFNVSMTLMHDFSRSPFPCRGGPRRRLRRRGMAGRASETVLR